MSCPCCVIAKVNPRFVRYEAGCSECSARWLAGDPRFRDAMEADAMTPDYRRALHDRFGADWQAAHERVKVWAEKLKRKA